MSDCLDLCKFELANLTKSRASFYMPLGRHFHIQQQDFDPPGPHICANVKRIRTQLTVQVEQRR